MLLLLAYLGITNAFALLRLVPVGDHNKDVEILALRHQLALSQRQMDGKRVRLQPADRAWLAALLHRLPRPALRRPRLLVATCSNVVRPGLPYGAVRARIRRKLRRRVPAF